ncbi:AimR family lysis-lysogeny pheromone receptor [Alkalihalobacillus sp. LMS39]|uniref:AimR family lysis-lysogeny pheromone receptor n=1 Tax=Alkalihalobacillus sp. LMS39 TaxID=2924032 RepID=UPI001FB2971B|nr:AimR family lysis-lysogeny pheromone receptor [Alkalihalobacillus sp. LMS39]UOE93786.1 AimR family lysis-lysogeny pheromone receptor [Alkalihalobacillus sp. LMS39]
MSNIRSLLSQELQTDPSLLLKISEISGFKEEEINSFLTNETVFLDFGKLLDVIDSFFPEQANDLIEHYIKSLNINHPTAQQVLEYVFINRLDYSFPFLYRMMGASNEENQNFASIYKFHYENYAKPFKYDFRETKSSPTLHAFKTIMEAYTLYKQVDVPTLIRKKEYVEYTINNFVKDEFIRNYYLLHHYRVLMGIMLDQNEIEECRRMANEILQLRKRVSLNFANNAYHCLGISYLFEDYDKGIYYLKKTRDLYRKMPQFPDSDIHSSINLHQMLWNREPEELRPNSNVIGDKHDIVFYFVHKHDFESAKEILFNIDESKISQRDSAFHFYLKGILEDDSDHLYKSIMLFKQIGNKFYIQLPINELKKKGMNPILLDTLLIN